MRVCACARVRVSVCPCVRVSLKEFRFASTCTLLDGQANPPLPHFPAPPLLHPLHPLHPIHPHGRGYELDWMPFSAPPPPVGGGGIFARPRSSHVSQSVSLCP